MTMMIEAFFDERTFTLTYVVFDPETKDAVVIDPVLDYEPASSSTFTESVDQVVEYIARQGLNLRYILETHAHADHLTGSQILKQHCPNAQVAIGEHITKVQGVFKGLFDLPDDFPTDGSQFDRLLVDGETVEAGSLTFKTLHTPGHTPACVTYLMGDAIFTGDALFMPDFGTGRCDFPAGSAKDLYHSIIDQLYTLPDETRVFVGHDYLPGGREMAYETTIGESKARNVQLREGMSEVEFVTFREARDATLNTPRLLFQSVQVNVDAGAFPEPSQANQVRYLKIPVNIFRQEDPLADPAANKVELGAV